MLNRKLIYLLMFTIAPMFAFSQFHTIKSNDLIVEADANFPLISQYQFLKNNTVLQGSISNNKSVLINGVSFQPRVSSTVQGNSVLYKMNIDDLDVIFTIKLEVTENLIDLKFVDIKENGNFKIHTIAFPEHELLTVSSKEENANFAGSKMFTATEGTDGDVFQKLNRKTPLDSIPKGFLYGILSNKNLSASIWTNSVQEENDTDRIIKKTFKKGNTTYTSLWSGSWLYRADRITSAGNLPELKIIITDDANNDRIVDWQDGAIAFRKIMNNPFGAERVKDWVVFRIPMNFASQATNPFSKSLDETKRIFLNTDGLGQFVILKGYGGEGHDSNHPDYGYIGTRQGGVEELNLIADKANLYNADIGVHINGTESYPEARMFSEDLVDKNKLGWNWLDQSYRIDKRYDAIDDKRYLRLKSLKDQVPNLDFIYLDVWYNKGSWDSRKIAAEINSLGLPLATEFPQDLEYNAVWNHWAVDYKYGGKKIKGFNSKIARFIRNHQKDTWIARHPLLGGAEMVDFEGWQGRVNYNNTINVTFETNLPTKYLQHFPILKWTDHSIELDKNVEVKMQSGKKIITKGGKVVLEGQTYLLPWNPLEEKKLYHWNEKGGTTNWSLPQSWSTVSRVFMYEITDLGKVLNKEIPVHNGMIQISAKAKTPYVLYKEKQSDSKMIWGEGTLVKNGGFNSGNTDQWTLTSDKAKVVRDSLGDYKLQIDPGNETTTVSQILPKMAQGSYVAEVYVQTSGNRKAAFKISTSNGTNENYTTSSLWKNYIAADSKHDSKMQKMFAHFNVDEYHDDVKVELKTSPGDSIVVFDDVRVTAGFQKPKNDSIYFQEDFEHIPSGLFPFVKGEAGGVNDPRVHLAEKHSPYTQKGWNGKKVDDVLNGNWSLKIHEDSEGLIIQTIPQHLRFEPNKNYKISFNYQTESDDYAFVLGDNTTIIFENKISKQLETKRFEFEFTASASGNSWFGIKKNNKETSDFILDDIIVQEITKNP